MKFSDKFINMLNSKLQKDYGITIAQFEQAYLEYEKIEKEKKAAAEQLKKMKKQLKNVN